MHRFAFPLLAAYLCTSLSLYADEYKIELLKEIDLKEKISAKEEFSWRIAYINRGNELLIQGNAKNNSKAIFLNRDNDKFDIYDWNIFRDVGLAQNATDVTGKNAYFAYGSLYSFDLKNRKWSKLFNSYALPDLRDIQIIPLQDKLIWAGLDSISRINYGNYNISEKLNSPVKLIKNVTAFCFQEDNLYYVESLDSKGDFRVFKKNIQNDEKPELLFTNEMPGCIRLIASDRHVVACTRDSRLAIYDKKTKKTSRTNPLFDFTISNAIFIPKSDLLLFSSFDKKGDPNLVLYSCKEEKLIASIAADKFGVQAMALDAERGEIAAIGVEGVLRLFRYKK